MKAEPSCCTDRVLRPRWLPGPRWRPRGPRFESLALRSSSKDWSAQTSRANLGGQQVLPVIPVCWLTVCHSCCPPQHTLPFLGETASCADAWHCLTQRACCVFQYHTPPELGPFPAASQGTLGINHAAQTPTPLTPCFQNTFLHLLLI